MKKHFPITLLLLCALSACSSSDEELRDMNDPEISSEGITAMPIDCQVYERGGVIPFNYVFNDNLELGSYNIEIHNNFNHHTHSTTSVDCEQDEKKAEVNPWVFDQDFTIPSGLRSFTARHDISIPANVDTGDYHFMIRLLDKTGRMKIHSVAIKIK
ncbi:MAG: DUF4625 domain-containing protein [Prevotella sp.]|nr:DUF4625 domain-containing protein [Prevotella sp.]MBR1462138.1 DUF4625 domain-containing protein [Prevotella sp.]